MNKISATTFVAMALGLTGLSAHAGTPNTTAAGAVSYEVGQGWVSSYVDETAQNRWFAYKEFAGRSYCVDAAMGSGTSFPLDPNLTLYTDTTGATVFLANSDSTLEPPRNKGATICYASPLASGTLVRAFKVNVPIVAASGDSGLVRTQVVESSLYGEWFSQTTDSTGATAIKTNVFLYNHTRSAISATLFLPYFGKMGPYTVPAEGGMNTQPILSNAPNFTYASPGYIIHDGYPGALSGWFDDKYPANGNVPVSTVRYNLMPR